MTKNESDPGRETPYETLERRYNLAVNLESWELLAMHSISNEEVAPLPLPPSYYHTTSARILIEGEKSIPRIRLRMLKAFAGLPTEHLHYVRPVTEQPQQSQPRQQQQQQHPHQQQQQQQHQRMLPPQSIPPTYAQAVGARASSSSASTSSSAAAGPSSLPLQQQFNSSGGQSEWNIY